MCVRVSLCVCVCGRMMPSPPRVVPPAVQEETGANIDANRDTLTITVRGSDGDAVAKAAQAVADIVKEAGGEAGGDTVEKRLTVERRSVAAVIGTGGATVRRIQEESGARITIDKVSVCVCVYDAQADVAIVGCR